MDARIAIEPAVFDPAFRTDETEARHRRETIQAAVARGGGTVVPAGEANGLVWLAIDDSDSLIEALNANPGIVWVQLPWAGVEAFARSGMLARPVSFTCAKGVFGGHVGEHALMLILAGLRHVVEQARTPGWLSVEPELLEGKRITILGAGGIATRLTRLLGAVACPVTVLRGSGVDFPGAVRTLPISHLHAVLPETDVLVLALPLTPETHHIVGAAELDLLPPGASLVNVARGEHVDTEALVAALETGRLRAAGLDVTEPEPLPSGHSLWSMNNVLITSHAANSVAYATDKLAERVLDNVIRFQRGDDLVGVVDPVAGY